MAKRSRRSLSKKWMPADAKRITNSEGKRVWLSKGVEFFSLRDLIFNRPIQLEVKETPVESV